MKKHDLKLDLSFLNKNVQPMIPNKARSKRESAPVSNEPIPSSNNNHNVNASVSNSILSLQSNHNREEHARDSSSVYNLNLNINTAAPPSNQNSGALSKSPISKLEKKIAEALMNRDSFQKNPLNAGEESGQSRREKSPIEYCPTKRTYTDEGESNLKIQQNIIKKVLKKITNKLLILIFLHFFL